MPLPALSRREMGRLKKNNPRRSRAPAGVVLVCLDRKAPLRRTDDDNDDNDNEAEEDVAGSGQNQCRGAIVLHSGVNPDRDSIR